MHYFYYLCIELQSKGTMAIPQQRIAWLDWMKVLALLSIVWGHFFSEGYEYLYVFSVQVFCVISGFLYRQAPDGRSCLVKNARQLLVPTVVLSLLMQLEAALRCWAEGTVYDLSLPWYLENLLLGHRWCMGPCWFFYTLFIIRVLMQWVPRRWWAYCLLLVVSAAGAIAIRYEDVDVSNAWTNVLVCLPPFVIGMLLRPLKERLTTLRHHGMEVALLLLSAVVVWLCGQYNGEVWMYLCGYGRSFLLFMVGTLAGSALLYVLSLWLSRLPSTTVVETLARGSILIVGLHILMVRRLTELPDRFWQEDLFFAVFILLGFYPLILLVQRYCPWLMGQYLRK